MKFQTVLLAASILSFASVSQAQSPVAERNATREEILGNWRLIPLPDALEPKFLKSNPWPSACQWFSYSDSNVLKSIDHTTSPCEEMTSADLTKVVLEVAPIVSWKYDISPTFKKALLIISRSDVKGYAEYWEPHLVTETFSNQGVTFDKGDLLLYLVNLQEHKLIWIRHLRRLE